MINKVSRKKTLSMKERIARIARIKTPSQRKETQPMKVNTPKAIKYVASLKRNHTPLVKKLHNVLLAVRHQVITMEQFEKLLKEYPEVTEISSKGKQSFLNSKISTVQAYDNGSLVFTIILSEGVLYKFKK